MQTKKIVIVGNSVALRNRPHTPFSSRNYGQLIEDSLNHDTSPILYDVVNLAFGRATMRDLHKIQDIIINNYGDLYIFNIGVSDAATREIPRWYADVLNSRKYSLKKTIFRGIHQYFIVPIRRTLVFLIRITF